MVDCSKCQWTKIKKTCGSRKYGEFCRDGRNEFDGLCSCEACPKFDFDETQCGKELANQ